MGRGSGSREASFGRCLSLLQRGIVTGSDVTELLEHFEDATETVGMSLASGFCFAPEQALRDLSPEWPKTHARFRSSDPSPDWLDRNGPYAVYSVARRSPADAWEIDPLLRAFTREGFADGAISRVGRPGSWIYLAAYRTRPQRPYDDMALTRMHALLPWMDLAFGQTVAQQALASSREETEKQALRRIGAYVLLDPAGKDEPVWSQRAIDLFSSLYEGFGARGRHRIERAIRRAHALVVAGRGSRTVPLRTDLDCELSLLPRPKANALLLASFTRGAKVDDQPGAPYEELLSPRQRLIARRLVRGDSIPQIAAALSMSPEAVKSHVREIYRRLAVTSRVELARLEERSRSSDRLG